MLSKSLCQFSVDGWSCVPSLLFTWGQTMVEVMKIMVTFKRSHACTATLSAPNPVAGHCQPYTSAGDSWTLTGKSGSVSCWITAPFSWVLVHTRFCLCPPKVCFPGCASPDSSVVGLMAISSRRAYPIPSRLHPQPPSLWQSTADPYLHRRCPNTVLLSFCGLQEALYALYMCKYM